MIKQPLQLYFASVVFLSKSYKHCKIYNAFKYMINGYPL